MRKPGVKEIKEIMKESERKNKGMRKAKEKSILPRKENGRKG